MITHRQWLLLFICFIAITTLCLVAEGATIGEKEVDPLNKLMDAGWSWGGVKATGDLIWGCIAWDYNFFETGIGIWIKIPLMCLSAAVIIPLGFELYRLIFKPFGG